MKVLMLNGSPHEKGCTYTALMEVAGELEKAGIQTEIMHVGGDLVHGWEDAFIAKTRSMRQWKR